jgi:hypothetical protein
MSKSLKGFVIINSLLSNTAGTISPLGELSTCGMTFTKEPSEYESATVPGYRLFGLKSFDTNVGAVAAAPALVDQVLGMVAEAYEYVTTQTYPYVNNDFKAALIAAFPAVTGLTLGNWIQVGAIALPEWIAWTSTDPADTTVKIWLSDAALTTQYDEYAIEIIPPMDNLNDFFLPRATVKNLLDQVTVQSRIDLLQQAKQRHPETYLRSYAFTCYDPNTNLPIVGTNWYVLVYGQAGDNLDLIKGAIVEYLLANSTHTQGDWILVFPDLIQVKEFVVLPRWDLYAIPDLPIQTGVYSSVANPQEVITFATDYISFYPSNYTPNHIRVVPFAYREVNLLIVKGYNNNPTTESFMALFEDYLPVPTSSLDFNRMTQTTRDWVLGITDALAVAEVITPSTLDITTLSTVTRDGKLYVVWTYQNIDYLIAAKSNLP